jgi:hypothetical protein
MKITIITSFPFPNGKATANRMRIFAEELLKNNRIDSIDIVCSSSDTNRHSNFTHNIKIINIMGNPINKNNYILRAFKELSLSIELWRTAYKTNSDIYIVSIPSILLLLPIIFFKKPKLLVLDIRDAVWTYFSKGFINNFLKKILEYSFKLASKKANIISVTNKSEALIVKKIQHNEPIIVPNGISNKKLIEVSKVARKSNVNNKNINMTYIGNVGIAQELGILLNFSKKEADNVSINIIGDGAQLKHLKTRTKIENIQNINFFGSVPPENVLKFMENADVLFAQIGSNFSSAVPTKIFEYIASGRKILLGLPDGPAKDIFKDFYGVEIFNTGDIYEFQISYSRLINTELSDAEIELNLNHLKRNYVREKSMHNFLIHFDKFLKDLFI